MSSLKSFVAVLLFLFTIQSYASVRQLEFSQVGQLSSTEVAGDLYYEIDSVELRYLGKETARTSKVDRSELGAVLLAVDKLIATGQKIWKIVQDGEPVYNFNNVAPLNVFPKLETELVGFYEMESWSLPTIAKYEVVFKNGFGMEVVNFNFNVSFQHSGSYQGKGSYLGAVSLQASGVDVAWGYNLDATSKLVGITNHGTKDSPVAGATISLDYMVKTVIKKVKTGLKFHVTGNGKFLEL